MKLNPGRGWKCLVVALGAGFALGAAPRQARACGASPQPWYIVDRQAPLGTGVPVDAPIVVELKEASASTEAPIPDYFLQLQIVGSDQIWNLSPDRRAGLHRLVFVPPQPLAKNITYRVLFSTGQTPADGSGQPVQPTEATWEFATSAETSPPLALEGELQVALEAGVDPIFTCSNNCGSDCMETGKAAVTKARVTLPRLSGGVPGKFFGRLTVTSDEPVDFTGGPDLEDPSVSLEQTVEFIDGVAPQALVTLPSEVVPYTPCFALQVSDDRGNTVPATPLCLDDTVPSTAGAGGAGSDLAGQAGSPPINNGQPGAHPPLVDDTVEPRTSSSCSFAAAPRGALWPLAVAALLLTRRRRSEIAP